MLTLTIIARPEPRSKQNAQVGESDTAGQVIPLPEQGGVVGRHENCDICLPDASRVLSRQHCDVRPSAEGYTITNLSRNGAQLNGEEIPDGSSGGVQLHDGDLLTLGGYRLLVSYPENMPHTPITEPGLSVPPSPPVLTEQVAPAVFDFSHPVEHSVWEGGHDLSLGGSPAMGGAGDGTFGYDYFRQGLAGIDALSDEVLREFSPERLEHKLAPWRKKGWRRQSWWSLYRSYYEQMERTGELHLRLREWFLRSGGFGQGGS